MATTAFLRKQSHFSEGITAGLSISIGYMPVAITFGLLASDTGLTLSETVLMSIFVFAGAAQYISLSLIAAGTGVFEIIFTTFIVNIRHFLMSASLNEKVDEDSLWKKALYSFGITDETFSVASMKEGNVSAGYMFGLIFISYSSWVVFSGVGHLIGANLPETLQESMSVALYAMFIGLLVPSMKKQRKVVFLASAAGVIHSLIYLTGLLSTGWAIVLSTLLSAILIEMIYPKEEKRNDQ
jgi:4-azaleucine resistance transporter AzlC